MGSLWENVLFPTKPVLRHVSLTAVSTFFESPAEAAAFEKQVRGETGVVTKMILEPAPQALCGGGAGPLLRNTLAGVMG